MAESTFSKLSPTSKTGIKLMLEERKVCVDLAIYRDLEVKINGKAAGSLMLRKLLWQV